MNLRSIVAAMALPVVAGFVLGTATAPQNQAENGKMAGEESIRRGQQKISALSPNRPGAAAMLSRVANHPGAGGFTKLMAYMKLVQTAEVDEFPELMERIRSEVDGGGDMGHTEILMYMLVRRWAAEDSLGALEAVLSGKPPAMRGGFWHVVEKVAEEHPREAWEAVRAMENRGERPQKQQHLMNEIARRHPAVTLELLAGLSPSADRGLLKDTLGKVAGKLPLETMAFAESLPAGALRPGASLVFVINGEDHLSRQLASGVDEARTVVARAWAETDPKAAVAWAEQTREGARGESALAATVAVWGQGEPEAAMEYARANLGSAWQGQVMDKALASSELSIDRRRALAEAQGGIPVLSYGYQKFAVEWARQDAVGLGAWLADRPGADTDFLMAEAARSWAKYEEAAAAVGVVEIADPAMRQMAINGVARRLVEAGREVEMAPEVRAAVEALKAERSAE